MIYPDLNTEKKLWKKGIDTVIGVDEAGRGPLAGPVVASAVMLTRQFKFKNLDIRDSKKLSAKQRRAVYNALNKNPNVAWGLGIISEKIIDRVNIFEASKLAMKKAVSNLFKKTGNKKPAYLIIDGKFRIGIEGEIPDCFEAPIIRADEKIMSVSIASIFAKVKRDKIMERYHKKYPNYGFDRHKGYGTAHHYEMLKLYGPARIHRTSFDLKITG